MILKNQYFFASVTLTIVQQLSLAFSTYFIALAGKAFAYTDYDEMRLYVTLFFVFALFAYFISSCVQLFQIKFKNNLWENYVFKTLNEVTSDQKYSSGKNKHRTVNWLTGEVPAVFEDTSQFSINIISLYCNVGFTITVFWITLGKGFSGIILASICLSVLMVSLFKKHISLLAKRIQETKLDTIVRISGLWDKFLFANKEMMESGKQHFDNKIKTYFRTNERYVVLEQVIACLPIYIAVPMVICMMYFSKETSVAVMGSLIAVLPRTLQLLGSVHSLSLCNAKLPFIYQKIQNLKSYISTLDVQDLNQQIDLNQIEIVDLSTTKKILLSEFIEQIKNNRLSQGRYCITGKNGTGKTSLLKYIKLNFDNAIFISPETNLTEYDFVSSSGERKISEMDYIFSQQTEIFLLDEWDANLDNHHAEKINQKIDVIAKKTLVIEVRHLSLVD